MRPVGPAPTTSTSVSMGGPRIGQNQWRPCSVRQTPPSGGLTALRPMARIRTVEHRAAGQGTVAVPAVRRIDRIFHPSDFSESSEVAFAHALKLALVAEAELAVLHVSEGEDVGWTEFPRVRAMLERWHVLPPNSPREAVPAIGIEVRKVVMKGSDPVRAAEHFLQGFRTDLV